MKLALNHLLTVFPNHPTVPSRSATALNSSLYIPEAIQRSAIRVWIDSDQYRNPTFDQFFVRKCAKAIVDHLRC